jgi:hypothetical protein
VAPMAAPAVAPAVSWRVESLWRMGDMVGVRVVRVSRGFWRTGSWASVG